MILSRHERCRAAIANQSVDRVPGYCCAISCEVASELLGRKAYTGTCSLHFAEVNAWSNGPAAHDEWVAQHEQDIADIHRLLDLDVFAPPWRMNVRPTLKLDEFTFLFGEPQGEHVVYQYDPASGEFAAIKEVRRPQTPEQRIETLVTQMEADEADMDAAIARQMSQTGGHSDLCRALGEEFFVVCGAGGIGVGVGEDDLMALALAPHWMARKCWLQAQAAIASGRWLVENRFPAVMLGGGDLAGNDAPMYSPTMFRDVVLPAYRHAMAHLLPLGVHYLFRSDGNIWPLAEMLFSQAGCPGFGEADRDAGMSLAALRRRFPNLVIWGNMSSRFLVQKNASQVRDEARRQIDEAGGHGFFQACANAIVKGTPLDNVLALFETR